MAICGLLVVALVAWSVMARRLAPLGNTDRERFDAIIVLGTPADRDGNPTAAMTDRVTEAVAEYQRGVAPLLLMTGGPAHNQFAEARVMAHLAEAQGVPSSVILLEDHARDTIENACYAERILKARGLDAAEVVTSPSHLPRAALIFGELPMQFHMHAAAENLTSSLYARAAAVAEVVKTGRYLAVARWTEKCQP